MKKRKIARFVTVLGVTMVMFGSAALAGTTMYSYNACVGRLNGRGKTEEQTKKYDAVYGKLHSSKVGGNYVVDVRMANKKAAAKWVRDIDDGTECSVPANSFHTAGLDTWLEFSNDLTTPVNVCVYGVWASN